MKHIIVIVFTILILIACKGGKTVATRGTATQPDNCQDVPKLSWQIESRGLNDSTTSKLIADIQAAAKADAIQGKNIGGTASVKFNSELAKVVSLNIKQSSAVSQEFWEQDLTFRQIICFYNSKMGDPNLTQELRGKFAVAALELGKTRSDYTFELKKKNGSNP